MNKIYLWFTAIVAVITFSLSGCKKDNGNPVNPGTPGNPDPAGKTHLPVKVSSSAEVLTFKYLANSEILSEVEVKEGTTLTKREIVTYNTNNQPVKSESFENGILVETTNFQLDQAGDAAVGFHFEIIDGKPLEFGRTHFTYNTNHQLMTMKYNPIPAVDDPEELRFEYDAKGNIIKYIAPVRENNKWIELIWNLEYDTNSSAYKNVKNVYLFNEMGRIPSTQNNILKITSSNASYGTLAMTYEYNADQFPLKSITDLGTLGKFTNTFVYSLK